jgi:hypothetical protein
LHLIIFVELPSETWFVFDRASSMQVK